MRDKVIKEDIVTRMRLVNVPMIRPHSHRDDSQKVLGQVMHFFNEIYILRTLSSKGPTLVNVKIYGEDMI